MQPRVLSIILFLAVLIPVVAVADDETLQNPGIFGTSFLTGWTRSVGVGISGSEGTTDEVKVIADTKGEFADEIHRRKLTSQFYLSKVDVEDEGADRKAFIEYEENLKPFANHFFVLGIGRFDHDRLEAWDYRVSFSLGVGSELVTTEQITIRASVGAGVNHVWQLDDSYDKKSASPTSPEGVVRLSGEYAILEDVSFETTHTYYPNFDDSPEFRLISDAEFKADIGEKGGLTTSVGVTNEYDSLAAGENNDLTYYLRLGYDF